MSNGFEANSLCVLGKKNTNNIYIYIHSIDYYTKVWIIIDGFLYKYIDLNI